MTLLAPPSKTAVAPGCHIDSPDGFIRKAPVPITASGRITGWLAGEPPVIRIRLGKRMLYCQMEAIPNPGSPAGDPVDWRFEAHFATRGGLKFLCFEILTAPNTWRVFGRRLVYAQSRADHTSYKTWLLENARVNPPRPPPPQGPLISVLVPVYNAELRWLQAMIDSVRRQTYTNWELCLADDASTHPAIPLLLAAAAATDARIKWIRRDTNGHISAATNSALALATGDYVAFLDQDDLLAPEALSEIAHALRAHPTARIIYSDEDKIDVRGRRYSPHFKSSWNPDLLLGQNYFCHLTAYETVLVRKLGGLRRGYEGAQDWDLALRAVTEVSPGAIVHIPRILYHWRAVKGSTARANDEKTYHLEAARLSLRDHLARNRMAGEVLPVTGGHWRVRYFLPSPAPKVTLIIPTRNRVDLLRPCVESIFERTAYPDFELLIIDNGSDDPATLAYLNELAGTGRARILRDDGPFNYSALNNRAARASTTPILALLNNDIEPITPDWLDEMVSLALRPSTGAVGALLLYPNETIQHAGVVLGITGNPAEPGIAGHAFLGKSCDDNSYFNKLRLTQNYSAVTAACLVVRREVFLKVGGFDEHNLPVAFNDVDLCLRLNEAGYHTTWTPAARLYHHESASRGGEDTPEKSQRAKAEIAYMRRKWGPLLDNDPAYSPNLSLQHHDWSLASRYRQSAPTRSGRHAMIDYTSERVLTSSP
jgi:O-antigen biosynthesis protein